ncbi:MAG: acyl-CoA/acyl-ACP dehydrogenase [Alphaproteobacteria bacterium]|nr:acyl-CoA/acyl-ACP dehydrogenase [Alphaproteobacteria bacterium]
MLDLGRLGFSEEQADLLEVATRFCRERSPISKVRSLMLEETGFDTDLWTEIAALGWLGIAIPEAYGGSGLTLAETVPIVEQMGRRLLASPFVPTTLAAQTILAGGTEAQKEALLPRIAQGARATLALAEPDGDWRLEQMTSLAEDRPDGRIALSGEKRFVLDAGAAEILIVSVRRHGEPQLALLEASDLPTGALRREIVIDETRRSFALSLDGVVISASALFDPARVRAALDHVHLAANLLSAAEMSGGALAAIEYTVDYARTRKQFGKLIGSYQAVKHPLVDAYVRYEQARSHLYSAAHCFSEQGAGEIAVRMARIQTETVFAYAADRSIQFHGGFGFTYDCDAQLYRRRALWNASQNGDAIYHRRRLASLIF